jgi:hypothetical protein
MEIWLMIESMISLPGISRLARLMARLNSQFHPVFNHALYSFDARDHESAALIWAIDNDRHATAQLSIHHGPEGLLKHNARFLSLAIKAQNSDIVQLLLENGADLNTHFVINKSRSTTEGYVSETQTMMTHLLPLYTTVILKIISYANFCWKMVQIQTNFSCMKIS